jgi:hypothetical protein
VTQCLHEGHQYAGEVDETGALFLGTIHDPHPDGVFTAVCGRPACRVCRLATWAHGELVGIHVSALAVPGEYRGDPS